MLTRSREYYVRPTFALDQGTSFVARTWAKERFPCSKEFHEMQFKK